MGAVVGSISEGMLNLLKLLVKLGIKNPKWQSISL